ncbi:MAG: ABC transporter permease [Bacteroidales bacterium]|nr:ABC transporter permease [Bacteroidales bacterium]
MKTWLIFAWRNLWRNRRRTLITSASVFFGVIFAIFMGAMQEGTYEGNIQSIVQFYTGYAQLQHPDYWEEKTLQHTITPGDSLLRAMQDDERITHISPRLEYFSLASHDENTKVASIVGINPEMEKEVTKILSYLKKGQYLEKGSDGVLIGRMLAENLGLETGDTLVLTGQGYHMVTAAGLFPIKGIVDFPSSELSKTMIYMDIERCREYLSAPEMLTSVVVMLEDQEQLQPVENTWTQKLDPEKYTLMTWREMQPEMVQQIDADRASGVIFLLILYMIIMFGILGTVMMMMAERRRELGVMMAVGMKRIRLVAVVFLEMLCIGFIGVISGILISIPIIAYYVDNPIPLKGKAAEAMAEYGWEPFMYVVLDPQIFINQALVIFVITIVIALYPLVTIYRMKEIDALRA